MKIKTLTIAKSKSKKAIPHNANYPVTASAIHNRGLMLAYGCGYDWSKGCEEAGSLPSELFIHIFPEEDVKKRAPKI